jgi:hypothetical protein
MTKETTKLADEMGPITPKPDRGLPDSLTSRPGYDRALETVRRYRDMVGEPKTRSVLPEESRGAWTGSPPGAAWRQDA